MKNYSIPYMSDEELMRRYLKIKPVATVDGVKYWLRNYSLKELSNMSYIWYARTDKQAPVGTALEHHTCYDFECLHTYGYPGFFKPSISEVLAQIPEEIFKQYSIDAFEIIDRPRCSADFNKHKEAFDKGFHTSIVRLYLR